MTGVALGPMSIGLFSKSATRAAENQGEYLGERGVGRGRRMIGGWRGLRSGEVGLARVETIVVVVVVVV